MRDTLGTLFSCQIYLTVTDCIVTLLAAAHPLEAGVLQHVGGSVSLLPGLPSVGQGRVRLGVVWVTEAGVALVIEAGVGQTQASDEGPHLGEAPVQHRVHPHHTRPVSVCRGEVTHVFGA